MESYITKRKPQTIDNVFTALFEAKQKNNVTAPADNPLRPATQAALLAMFTDFNDAYNVRILARQAYRAKTNAKNVVMTNLRMNVSHFFQNLNNAIKRKVATFTPDVRTYYNLEENQTALPDLVKETDVQTWAYRIVTGDANRVAGTGGPALAFPSAAEVEAILLDVNTKVGEQSVAYSAYNNSQEALQALKTDALAVINLVWADVESTLVNDPDAGSRRAKAAQWGVVYVTVNNNSVAVKVTVTDDATGQPIENAEIFFEAADLEIFTNESGLAEGGTNYVGADVMRVEKAGYVIVNMPVTFTGSGEFVIGVALVSEV